MMKTQLQLSVLGVTLTSRSVDPTSARTPKNTTGRAPKRSVSTPDTVIVAAAAMPWGASRRPAWRVSIPSTCCMKTGIRKTAPKRAMASTEPTAMEAEKAASRNTLMSSSGCSWRSSQLTKPAARRSPARSGSTACQAVQPSIEARVRP